MGWDINYGNTSKADCVNEILSSARRAGWEVLAHKSTSQGAYFAVRVPNGDEFIYVALIERRGKHYAVKTMDEGMGPVAIDCPLYLLDMVKGFDRSYSAQWRESVRAHHARTSKAKELIKTLKPGDTVTLYKNQYVIAEILPTKIIAVKDGQRYRIGKAHFKSLSI